MKRMNSGVLSSKELVMDSNELFSVIQLGKCRDCVSSGIDDIIRSLNSGSYDKDVLDAKLYVLQGVVNSYITEVRDSLKSDL